MLFTRTADIDKQSFKEALIPMYHYLTLSKQSKIVILLHLYKIIGIFLQINIRIRLY